MSPNTKNAPQDEFTYECSICDSTYSSEILARTHMSWCDDEDHNWCNGFMPEAEVNVIDSTGEFVRKESGNGRYKQNINISDLPDEFSEIDRHIVMKAIDSRNVDTYQEYVDRVNASLRSQGLENRSYTHIVTKMKDFFDLNDTESFDDLTEKQQRVIKTYVENPYLSPEEIADKANVYACYLSQTIDEYDYIVESMTNEQNKTENIKSKSSLYTDIDSIERLNIIEYFAQEPTSDISKVADDLDYSVSYVSKTKDEFSNVIINRAEELDNNTETLQNEMNNTVSLWNELTLRHKDIIRELSMQDNPLNASVEDVINNVQFEVHSTYVSEVQSQYGEFAIKLKEAIKKEGNMRDAESIIDSIAVDEIDTEIEDTDEITDLLNHIEDLTQTAKSEIENANTDKEFVAGKISLAEQFQTQLRQLKN